MKLLLSAMVFLGGLMLTQNSYGEDTRVSGAAKRYSETMTILPCGKIVPKGLKDGSCKKDALAAQANPTGDKSAK